MRLITLFFAVGMLAACAGPAERGADSRSSRELAAERERDLARECRIARMERRHDPRCEDLRAPRSGEQQPLPAELPVTLPANRF